MEDLEGVSVEIAGKYKERVEALEAELKDFKRMAIARAGDRPSHGQAPHPLITTASWLIQHVAAIQIGVESLMEVTMDMQRNNDLAKTMQDIIDTAFPLAGPPIPDPS